jgi:hypothetical protein
MDLEENHSLRSEFKALITNETIVKAPVSSTTDIVVNNRTPKEDKVKKKV